jgi:hypothetical protein
MGKVLTLLITILLTIASAAGYLYLDKIISAGEIRIAEGQRQIEEGQSSMDEGEAALLAGKRDLTEGKEEYAEAEENLFLKWVDKLLNAGKGFKEGRELIAEGEKQVAEGEEKLEAGEERLHAGELKLSHGRERLRLAKKVRIACAIGAGIFASLAIVFGFRWRRLLVRVITHSPT